MEKIKLFFITFLIAVSMTAVGQNVDVSQTNQKLGMSDVTITCNSPLADGEILGRIIGHEEIWGAGNRENTTIEFLNDVMLEERKVNAVKYGLFTIHGKEQFRIRCSKAVKLWLSLH